MQLIARLRLRGLVRSPGRWLQWAWNYPFEDARLIVDQAGNVSYFSLSAHVQTAIARSVMILAAGIGVIFVGLSLSLVSLAWKNATLNESQRLRIHSETKLFGALKDYYANFRPGHEIDDTRVLELISALRDHDQQMQSLEERVSRQLAALNKGLGRGLAIAGLNANAERTARSNVAARQLEDASPRNSDFIPTSAKARQIQNELQTYEQLMAVYRKIPPDSPINRHEVSSPYGVRSNPFTGKQQFHPGVDLTTRGDKKVRVALTGRVALAGYHADYGNAVIVEHAGGVRTIYGHLESIDVRVGDQIKKGDVVGIVGSTGLSTGTHLHYEILVDGQRIDPLIAMTIVKNVQLIEN